MKKFLILIAAALMPVFASAQIQITTKKVKIADFPQKITKVVLSGNGFYDSAFQEEVSARWRVSPYEFCTLEDFEKLKGSDQYYFLLITEGQFKKESEPGIQFITLVKGGAEAAKGIDHMLEIVTMPFAAADFPSGRELVFLPALLDIIQSYTTDSLEKDISTLGGLNTYCSNITRAGDMDIAFAECDFSTEITETVKKHNFDDSIIIADEDTIDELAVNNEPNTLVSYVVAPDEPVEGSFCYKMLIDTQNHKLYYFRKHRIGKKLNSGFLFEDIKRITAGRNKAKSKN